MLDFPSTIRSYHNHYDQHRNRFCVSVWLFNDEGLYYGLGPTFAKAHADVLNKIALGLTIGETNRRAAAEVAARPRPTLSSDLDGLDLDI